MIIKTTFDPRKVVPYVRAELALAAAASAAAYIAHEVAGATIVALPIALIGVLGTALAIFLGFRNNTAAARWNEASQLWGAITSFSRAFARLVITFVDSHSHTPQYDAAHAEAFKREMVMRQIAWVNALRLQLRGQSNWDEVRPFLSAEEYTLLMTKQNRAAYLLQLHGRRIYAAMASGTLQGFDSFQLEGCLLQFTNQQAGCERIKSTPLLRQYSYFTRLFVLIFIALLPFCLIGALAAASQGWLLIPLTLLLAFVFGMVERVGAVTEDPFENRIQDVPLSAICREIERSLREQLDEQELPAPLAARDGYLF
jgi:putative membrane protein